MIVEAKDVTKTYQQMEKPVHALRGISLRVDPGDFTAIVGPSGCGKSTFLHMLGALDLPTSGNVLWHDESITAWKETERTKLRLEKIGFVFQRLSYSDAHRARKHRTSDARDESISKSGPLALLNYWNTSTWWIAKIIVNVERRRNAAHCHRARIGESAGVAVSG
jgi:putative ABC transport system ATP-binding protein